jgi:hypothetical protein
MKRVFLGIATLALCLMASSANAGILGNYLTFDGLTDTLTDESRTFLVQNDGNTSADIGDEVYGFARISNINGVAVVGQIAALFSLRIVSGSGTAADPFQHAPIGSALDPQDLRNLLPADMVAAIPAGGLNDSTMALILSNPSTANADNPLLFTDATAAGQMDNFTVASGWTWELSGAMLLASDFFETALTIPGPPPLLGAEAAGVSVQANVFGVPFLNVVPPVVHLHFPAAAGGHAGLTQAQFTIDIPTTFTAIGAPPPWTFTDNATFRLNPTPEPASMMAWLGLAGAFSAMRLRRRKS